MKNIWKTLPKPFFVLAPMEDVTDTVFRQIVKSAGKPDVFFTEFTNIAGMLSRGRERVAHRLQYTEGERPIIAQIWGNNPEQYSKVVKIIKEMKFDGVDINMGCPVKEVVAKGFCSGLIKNPSLAKEIIIATKEAAGDMAVSVKTRIGFDSIQTEEWIGTILQTKPDALTIHGRTVAEMSKVPAHWDEIGKAVALRNQMKSETIIIGNGDVLSRTEGEEKAKQYGVDGIMIGRGVFNNLWVFNKDLSAEEITHKQKIEKLIEHINLFESTWGEKKYYESLKKFYKIYISGMPDATEFRTRLMVLKDPKSTLNVLKERLEELKKS